MNFANPETTNLWLGLLAVVAVGQFVLLLAVVFSLKAAMGRAKLAMSLLVGGDVREIHGRLSRLLTDLETLISRGNTVLGAVERGAQDLGAAASAVSYGAQKALAVSSFEVKAVTTAIRTGFRWFMSGTPWSQAAKWRASSKAIPPSPARLGAAGPH